MFPVSHLSFQELNSAIHFFYMILSSFSFSAESRSRLSMWEISGMVGRGVLKGLNKGWLKGWCFWLLLVSITTKQIVNRNIELPEPSNSSWKFEFCCFLPGFRTQRHRHLLKSTTATPKKGQLSGENVELREVIWGCLPFNSGEL